MKTKLLYGMFILNDSVQITSGKIKKKKKPNDPI